MLRPARFLRLSKLLGAFAVLAGAGATVLALTGDEQTARQLIAIALALGGAGLIASAITFFGAFRRPPQDRS